MMLLLSVTARLQLTPPHPNPISTSDAPTAHAPQSFRRFRSPKEWTSALNLSKDRMGPPTLGPTHSPTYEPKHVYTRRSAQVPTERLSSRLIYNLQYPYKDTRRVANRTRATSDLLLLLLLQTIARYAKIYTHCKKTPCGCNLCFPSEFVVMDIALIDAPLASNTHVIVKNKGAHRKAYTPSRRLGGHHWCPVQKSWVL